MNTQIFKGKMLLLPVLFVLLQSFAGPEQPQQSGKNISAAVQYLGTENGQLVFAVNFERENSAARRSTAISIMANGDQEIYENHYRAAKMQVLFRVETQGISNLSFVISSGGEKVTSNFTVSLQVQEQINVVQVK